jgi:serum/glucocorticoid-regulated kinase 2
MSQERNIILTSKGIYNMKNKSLKRRIDMKVVFGVTVSLTTDEFVIHCCDIEYDYNFVSVRVKKIVEVLQSAYKTMQGNDLTLVGIDVKDIKSVVTQKKDKKSNQNYTKMPLTGLIPVQVYLYGSEKKNVTQCSPSPPISTENPNLKWNNNQAKIEDFKILKVLGRGSFGKVCLVEYTLKKELYAMKSLKKDVLLNQEQVENTLQEKIILSTMKHPFLVSLAFCFQTDDRIYFIMNFMRGGELFEHLRKFRIFDEEK